MPCAQQAHSCCRSPPAALAVSHFTTTLQPLAGTLKVSSGILSQQFGAWGCSRTQIRLAISAEESSSSERAEVAFALAGAAARSALVRALSARIM